ncbi:MAG: endonuclease [Bacteriovoracaceae bacterium]|nr:endonuclease [Bacteriovoracaceae bacterium]
MNKLILLFVLSFSLNSFSSTLDGSEAYYSLDDSLRGYQLKSKLKEIISKDHKDRGYGALLGIYLKSDADKTYDGDGSIVDMYSEMPNYADPYTYKSKSQSCGNYRRESDCYNREHIFPQSVFNKRSPMRSDFFHVYPSDGYVNGRRSNFPFGEVNRPTWTSANGSKVGKNSSGGYSGKVFEPIDEFKGDIARSLLYFATRYEDQVSRWHHAMLNGTKDQVYKAWFLKLLLKWHKQDPVSEHEIRRNNVGQSFQGNRNPFIDHPEWVEAIWGK